MTDGQIPQPPPANAVEQLNFSLRETPPQALVLRGYAASWAADMLILTSVLQNQTRCAGA